MTDLLLQTKIVAPPLRSQLVARPRLFRKLSSSLPGKLTLVAAPAGCGKTTLIGQWIGETNLHAAWFSIDEGDNDIGRFLAYLVAAASTLNPSVGQLSTSLIRRPQPPSFESVLTALINDMAGLHTTEPEFRNLVLVIDDYQLIGTQAVHDSLSYFIDNMPQNLHLVLASRSIPPIPLARLRAQGQLSELDADDLRFNDDEAASLMRNASNAVLSDKEVQLLADRTEGWAAGLQMAALALRTFSSRRQGTDVSAFAEDFSGSNRFILDYLIEEVMQGQSEEVQSFLVRTSILDQMTGELCDEVLELQRLPTSESASKAGIGQWRSPGQRSLEMLESSNLFLIPLDEERKWYRYHHLFRDLLRQRLSRVHPDETTILHRRAASWYERNGYLPEAIDHSLAAKDFYAAARLVENTADTTLMNSEVTTFLDWQEALPDEVMRDHPLLCLYSAIALLLAGRPLDAVKARLSVALQTTAGSQIAGEVGVLRAILAALQGDTREGIEISNEAIKLLPDDSLFLRSIALENLGLAHMASGDVTATAETLEATIRTGRETGNIMVGAVALCQLADQRELQGRLRDANSLYEQALELSTGPLGRRLPIAGMAIIGIGNLCRQWNRFDEALGLLNDGIELSQNWGAIGALDGYLALARIMQAQGHKQLSYDAIEKARQVAAQFDASDMDDIAVEAHIARLLLAQGELQAALDWAKKRGLEGVISLGARAGRAEASYHLREFEYITFARILVAQARSTEALVVLDSLHREAERLGRIGSTIEILTIQALAYKDKGDLEQAAEALKRAIAFAEPEGYVRIFADEGSQIVDLLRMVASMGVTPDYIAGLLAVIQDDRQKSHLAIPSQPKLLSPRELEVLRLVGIGLANSEIADELVISLNTVKWHVHNICKKLEARNRTEAFAKAKTQGIL